MAPEESKPISLISTCQANGIEVICAAANGRARSLNQGARQANGDFLWFVHADTQLTSQHVIALRDALRIDPQALHYFDIVFFDAPAIMRLNAWGTNLRSRWLGSPFGDQGLCLQKSIFFSTGGYPESVRIGEDHFWVRRARRQGISLHRIAVPLPTSGRKYVQQGWLSTTIRHNMLFLKQKIKSPPSS